MSLRRRLAAGLLAATTLVAPAHATWTVILVNSETREVIIASATCLANFDLQDALPVVRVGEGAAAAQSFVDVSGANRLLIWNEFIADTPPKQMIPLLAASDNGHQTRQYAIADWDHAPTGFSGTQVGIAKRARWGVDGPWRYSMAGNVLTAPDVILEAEATLLATEGDGLTKVLAAMETARSMGGDGRCSCAPFAPTSCGIPEPGSFEKAAHVGFLIAARIGDVDGVCNTGAGCASGDYFLNINQVLPGSGPDPVLAIQAEYDVWRASRAGAPDHYTTTVTPSAERLVADGLSTAEVVVQLVDIDGVPLTAGGATLTVVRSDADGASTSASPVVDLGDGSYRFELAAGATAGSDTYEITVDDGQSTVLLWPPLEIEVDPLVELHSGVAELSALEGGSAALTLNVPAPGQPYFVLASLAGTSPGVDLGGTTLPLVPDGLFDLSLAQPNSALFIDTLGFLDAGGRAEASVALPPGLAVGLVGTRVDLAAVVGGPTLTATNAAGFELAP